MKKLLRIMVLTFAASALLFVSASVVSAAEIVDQGTCGDNLTWVLDDGGTLTISGQGAMKSDPKSAPWKDYSESVYQVVVEEGVTSICQDAFFRFTSMRSVSLPESLEMIDRYAFYDCARLKSLQLPNNITSIGLWAFEGCSSITHLTIPKSVTKLGECAFGSCRGLVNLTVYCDLIRAPKSLDDYNGAFSYCTALSKVDFCNNEMTEIGAGSFNGCENLTNINLPDSIKKIEQNAFRDCPKLEDIHLPEELQEIGAGAFSYCSSLEDLLLPNSVKTIGNGAFIRSKSKVYVSNQNHYFCSDENGILFTYDMSELIYYPSILAAQRYIVPETVKIIRNEAFYSCNNLNTVYFPSGIKEMGEAAIASCRNLTDIRFSSVEAPDIFGNTMLDLRKDLIIHVPIDSLGYDSYPWFNYTIYNDVCNNHSWDTIYTIDSPASCTEDGSESIHCTVCDMIDSKSIKTIERLGHTYGEWITTKEVTCTEDGLQEKECSKCGDKVEKVIEAKGHVWNEGFTVDKSATCTEDGSKSIHCSVCNLIDDKTVTVIPKLSATSEHTWDTEYTVDKSATCTEDGSKSIHCSVCGIIDESTIITIPAAHKWKSSYTVDKKATYAAKGSKSIHCSVCNAIKEGSSVSIPKLVVKATTLSKVTAAKKGFTVKWKKGSKITGYQIQYALNSKFTKSAKKVTVAKSGTVSKKITKLKAKKKYYVRVRTYKKVSGKTYYSKWSKYKYVTTK